MLNYFPKYFTSKAITLYLAALMVVSVLFMNMAMSLVWWVFGIVEVAGFFYFSNQLTRKWANYSEKSFSKKLFQTALWIRLFWVFFSYFFYLSMTGKPFEFQAADSIGYHGLGQWLSSLDSVKAVWERLYAFQGGGVSDTGYGFYLINLYRFFGDGVLLPRIIKALLGAWVAVLIYRLAGRNFGEIVGRLSAILTALMPNLILYAGMHLKEAEMVFLTVFFVERADNLIRNKTYSFSTLFLPLLLASVLFFFRTVLGATALFSLLTAIMLSSSKVLNTGKKFLLGIWVALAITYFIGGSIATEVEQVWSDRQTNQQSSLEWRANRKGGNEFAKYVSGAVFAPIIFVIPFPTMVSIEWQKNQQLIHGGNFVKNILSFFVILAMFLLIKEKKWRDHLLLLSFTLGYLIVIALSAFAQSERFHQPALPFILIFAAYGICNSNDKTKRYFNAWLVFIFIAVVFWNWFKLAGRGGIS